MARLAYRALLWLALPVLLARLAWRARRQRGYLSHLGERFGVAPAPPAPVIWVHAVSVGETRAAAPLVEWLRRERPRATILLTHTTPTGRATGRELFGDAVLQAWLPWDHGFAVRRFLDRVRPACGLVLETEIWPTLLRECARRAVPVFLVNARLSARSAAGYARVPSLAREALRDLAGIAAQTPADAARLGALGACAVEVTGNVKFDLAVPEDIDSRGRALRTLLGTGRRVWLVASTREGEEAPLVRALEAAAPPPEVLVLFVPRHPQRFNEVAALLAGAAGSPVWRRSGGQPVPPGARYALGDTMGEMLAYCAAADVVLVGGSLGRYGGQNLIEPCAVGRPVIFGPHTFNFESAAEAALAEGAGIRVRDAGEAVRAALALLADEPRRARMGGDAARFAQANRGALARLAAWLSPRLPASCGPGPG